MQADVHFNLSNPCNPLSASRQAHALLNPLWVSVVDVNSGCGMPRMSARQVRRLQARKTANSVKPVPKLEYGDPHIKLLTRIRRELGPHALPAPQPEDAEPSNAEQIMEAYGYQALADGMIYMANSLFAGAQSMASKLPTLSLGVAVGATPVSAKTKPVQTQPQRTSLADFIKEFEKDFDIRISPSSDLAGSLQGFTVIIGEDHVDPIIQKRISQILAHMRPGLNDKLLIEGDGEICDIRSARYQIPRKHCYPLEANSAAYKQGVKEKQKYDAELIDVVRFLNQNIPVKYRQVEIPANTHSYEKFINVNQKNLPGYLQAGFQSRMIKLSQLAEDFVASMHKKTSQRDQELNKGIEQHADPELTNFGIMGAGHLGNLGPQFLRKKSVILMMPRTLAKGISGKSGGDPYRKEL